MSEESIAIGGEEKTSATRESARDVTKRWFRRLSQNRARRLASMLAVVLLMGCIFLTVMAGVRSREGRKSLVPAEKPAEMATAKTPAVSTSAGKSARPQSGSPTERLEVETIILTRFGFEPNNIKRSQAQFLLSVENRSPVGDIELHLDRVAGIRLHQQQVARERPDWREFFTLEPGDYVLSEASHPEWQCKIRITPR